MSKESNSILPCYLLTQTRDAIHAYADSLRIHAAEFRPEGMTKEEFWRAGLFHGAIERIRGQQSASMKQKRDFMTSILDYMKQENYLMNWSYTGSADRFDYNVITNDGKTAIIETKGCLDGNNTNIYQRPPNADEFYIWSLCQNPASDPRKNAWSGIHTRLSAEIVHRREKVDCVIIWDMLCGTTGRPCPKIEADESRSTTIENMIVPPPCIFLLPRSIPDPRDNPSATPWILDDLSFASSLCEAFGCYREEITSVSIDVRMKGTDIQRKTIYTKNNSKIADSKWTTIRRSR